MKKIIKNIINFLKNDINKFNHIEESNVNDEKEGTKITEKLNKKYKINENNNKNNNDLNNQDPNSINKIISDAIIFSKKEILYKFILLYIERGNEEIRNRIFNELISVF